MWLKFKACDQRHKESGSGWFQVWVHNPHHVPYRMMCRSDPYFFWPLVLHVLSLRIVSGVDFKPQTQILDYYSFHLTTDDSHMWSQVLRCSRRCSRSCLVRFLLISTRYPLNPIDHIPRNPRQLVCYLISHLLDIKIQLNRYMNRLWLQTIPHTVISHGTMIRSAVCWWICHFANIEMPQGHPKRLPRSHQW